MTIKEAAIKFISTGYSILPTKKDKSPDVKKWIDVDLTESDFNSAVGIGVKCGKASLGLECLDFDNHFADAKKNLTDFINQEQVKKIYEFYKLPIESTISGGFHMLYRCSVTEGNQKLASRPKFEEKTQKWRPDAIIETRGEGGYFVVAPSDGYVVIRNDIFNVQEIEPEERKILIETAKSFNQWSEPAKNEFEDNNKPGDYYNKKSESIDEMKSALLKAGWKELNKNQWRRPGKDKGISATIGKVADNVFYCFTANGHPFDENKGYTPFQVVCLLDYNGDFKKFAKDLADRYQLNQYQNNKVAYNKPVKQEKTEKELDDILLKTIIDVTIPYHKPPIILDINHNNPAFPDWKRLLTLGNISSLNGKGKAKKTFLQAMILSCLATNGIFQGKFRANLPLNKRGLLHIDTEQSDYDTYIIAKKIHDMSGGFQEHLATINLREYHPNDRVDILLRALSVWGQNVGFIALDGVADCITDINDIEQSINFVTREMEWTKKYNTHICNIIHQNKNDNYATGHLGSALIKKSEVVIGVEKDSRDRNYSIVSCQNIRGAQDFEDFSFYIDSLGMPQIDSDKKFKESLI